MSKRQNIFEIMNSKNDPLIEIDRIDELLEDEHGVYVTNALFPSFDKLGDPVSIVKYIDDKLFRVWTQRGTCISCNDFKGTLGLLNATEDEKENESYILNYCEYVANIIYLLKEQVEPRDTLGNNVQAVEQNIKLFLARYNFELKYFAGKEKALVVAVNAQATAVAEILDEQYAYSVVEYNHFLLKGDVSKKKAILKSLGDVLEPQRKEIEGINKELSNNIFFMLNNLNIRHNNRSTKDPAKYKEAVAKIQDNELEEWYDEIYQMMLLAFLLLDNVERSIKVKDLKDMISGGKKTNGQDENADAE